MAMSGWIGRWYRAGWCAATAAMLAWGVTHAAASPTALFELIDARLELMDEVASYKWQRGLPIEDLEREAVVLDRAAADALRFGLTPDSVRALFAAQIEAAKAIQAYWFERWAGGEAPPPAPDLAAEVRPALLRLGAEILAAASTAGAPTLAAPGGFADAIGVTGLDVASRAALLNAVAGLERYPDRLTQILDAGVLRVGTTGDYAPFSHGADGQPPDGVDVELARHLGDALDVRLEFVATSWPTLMADLAAGRFDIAMSGVSRTLGRQRAAFMSRPYYVGGKAPIARCVDADRFAGLEGIDRPGVRVVVNPGGTNEAFVDAHVHRADKILYDDNRTIFREIVEGRADVMITDRVEVELQASRHDSLCATMAGTLTYQEKAYLLPRDPVWLEFVNTWLDLALADGTVARTFRDRGIEPRLP